MRVRRIGIAAAGIMFALPAIALAANLRVPQDFPTIQDAVNAAAVGDRILISKGLYDEQVTANVNGLEFLGRKGAIWFGDENPCLAGTADNIRVRGIKFRGGAPAIDVDGNNIRVEKCQFDSADGDGIEVAGNNLSVTRCTFFAQDVGVDVDGDGATISKCTFHAMDNVGVDVDGNDATVEKCRFVATEDGPAIGVDGDDAVISKNVIRPIGGIGIDVDGQRAQIVKNQVTACTDDAIEHIGDDALISKNRLEFVSEAGIEVNGDRTTITKNRITSADTYGIDSSGEDVTIDRNRVIATGSNCIEHSGDDMTITNNAVQDQWDDDNGFYLVGSRGIVSGNRVMDIMQVGFYCRTSNVTISGNRVTRNGNEEDAAFFINGDGNDVRDNQAIDTGDDGFRIDGDDNTLRGNLARFCRGDGYDIVAGTGNGLLDCDAFDCDMEGLDNGGTSTTLTGGRYFRNHLDIGDDGTFTTFGPAGFGSGGQGVPAERD